ncbi:hypothetical protein NBO_8g0031 [Nosema bombycis CQ1]|uniref:CDT1 Geminin-binding domain-containing protein n=1 Tax=Nosema bombycis (strain CQ1 / CVCC 102059) TaxID=578461 RepID=R0KY68_NOSB1|nr:hypothetical protein NBO_8g0031 [Nosema bombycis CQ1]|eukprot:EOB15167.1 hypothetical protein NBO_8g0031 [Nosema bombycis CQ1]
MKTKNLKDYLNKNKKKVKVIEDSRARESICKTIEGIVFSDEILSSDIMSSDLLSEADCKVKKSKKECGFIESGAIGSGAIGSGAIEVMPIVGRFIENKLMGGPIECKPIEVTHIESVPIEGSPIEVTPPIEGIPLEVTSPKELSLEVTPIEVTTPIEVSNLDSRINKIKQFTNLNFNLDLNKLDTYLILPKPLLRLLKIFKSLLTIQNYNSIRQLTSIFIKVKGSIERTLRTRIEEEDIKKIYYLLGDKIEIKNLKIEDKGEMVKTFTFKIKCTGEEMEKRMREWCMEEKGKEVPCREWDNEGGEECGEDVKEMDGSSPLSPINPPSIDNPISPISNPMPPSNLTTPSSVITPLSPPSTKALNKTNSILERIKEKELKRKQEFIKKIQKKNEERDLIKRISILFKKEGKQALKMKDIIKILEIFEGERQIKGIVKENPGDFEIREISEEKYLIYKKVI